MLPSPPTWCPAAAPREAAEWEAVPPGMLPAARSLLPGTAWKQAARAPGSSTPSACQVARRRWTLA
jgi:hypothetical protein